MEAAVSPSNVRPQARLHPLMSAAAISVIAFSAAGVAAFTGILPKSIGATAEIAAASQPWQPSAQGNVPTPATSLADMSAAEPRAVEPAAKPAPAPKKRVTRVATSSPSPAPTYESGAVPPPPPAVVAQARRDSGTVQAVRQVKEKGEGSWIGPVAGGVGGAVLGSQVGKGTTRTIVTVLGAAGGAYAGREIEKHVRSTTHWEVDVRMEDGSTRTATYKTQPAFREGERVRYVDGQLVTDART
jgi:outer membrane lipoprotein SlyB